MTDLSPLFPRQPVPALSVDLVGGGTYTLSAETPDAFSLVVFYRGLHCPICKGYLGELEKLLPEFDKRGVSAVAISSDPADRAEKAKTDWALPDLRIGYGLDLDTARQWGLYVSTSRGKTSVGVEEPALFAEPGLFFVRPDGTLYFGATQTMPFARPKFADLLPALDFVLANDYPARGEVIDARGAAAA